MSDHYRLTKLGDELYSFTSPMGRHTVRASYGQAKEQRRRVKDGHMKQADGEGAVAEILRRHFSPVRTNP